MNREETISTLYTIGQTLVEEIGLTEVEVKDIDCGVWDDLVRLSDKLKKQFGDMEEVTYHNGIKVGRRWEKSVELGYRFSNPKLSVFGRDENGNETLASLEISDGAIVDGEYKHTGDYHFSEAQVWGKDGFEMQKRLMDMWYNEGGR